MSLRVRLIGALVGMLAALAGLGAWSAWRLSDMGTVSNRIIADNYDSVVAAQQMKESLERQDSALLFALLGERDRAERQQEILYMCREEGQRLARLSTDLLDLSKIEAGEAPPRLARTPAAALVRNAIEPLRLQVEAKGLALVAELPPDLPAVMADKAQIERVLAHLVTNSSRATPKAGRITVTAEARDGQVAIAVADTGVGIPAAYLRRIFEPFVQVPNGTGGAGGLGLAISRKLIEAHHGQMTVQSEPGAGAVFTFTLPLAPTVSGVVA